MIQRKNGTIYQGDCLEVLKTIDTNSIDMVLCDLPYGTTRNKWDSVIDLTKLWEQYNRVVKENGAIILNSQGIFTAKLILSNEKNFKYKFCWIKSQVTNFLNAKKQPLRKHEDICVFYRKQPTYNPIFWTSLPYSVKSKGGTTNYGEHHSVKTVSDGNRYPTDSIYCKSVVKSKHATQKPEELGRYLIKMFTNEGDTVLDNAFGSGSYLVAAELEKRKYVGIELSSIDLAEKRLEEAENLSEIPNIFDSLHPSAADRQQMTTEFVL